MSLRVSALATTIVLSSGSAALGGTLTFAAGGHPRYAGNWGSYTHHNVNSGSPTSFGGGGGAFLVTSNNVKFAGNPAGPNAIENGSFLTFCIEINEFISYGASYQTLANPAGAVHGGNGNTNPDPLNASTQWLYWNFRQNTLASYLTGSTDAAWDALSTDNRNAAIQYTLWYLEDEIESLDLGSGFGDSATRGNVLALTNGLRSLAENASPVIGQGRVIALNVANNGQDQLGILIPLPTAGGMSLAGFMLLGARRRRASV